MEKSPEAGLGIRNVAEADDEQLGDLRALAGFDFFQLGLVFRKLTEILRGEFVCDAFPQIASVEFNPAAKDLGAIVHLRRVPSGRAVKHDLDQYRRHRAAEQHAGPHTARSTPAAGR